MSKNSSVRLVKIIANLAIFLEFTDEGQLDPNLALEMMKQMAAELQSLNDDGRNDIMKILQDISKEYTGDICEFIKELPESAVFEGLKMKRMREVVNKKLSLMT